jgi:hypothetical protein
VLSGAGAEATDVEVRTDLAVTGKPAQFGRGVMQDVSDRLLQEFATCLESKLAGPAEVAGAAAAGAAQTPGSEEATGSAGRPSGEEVPVGGPPAATPGGPASEGAAAAPVRDAGGPAPGQDDALDLGATVLPVLLRAYWKQLAGAVLVVLVLRRLLGRRG